MRKFTREKKGIHPDVVEFYTMGDLPENLARTTFMQSLDDEVQDNRIEKYFKIAKGRADDKAKVVVKTFYGFQPAEDDHTLRGSEDTCSAFADAIEVSWTWGMKFLFQAVALQKMSGDDAKEGKGWRLWPFAQPDLNNRQIVVDDYLWNHNKPTKEQMIPSIFESTGNNFSNQKVYSVPYIVKAKENNDGGQPLISMVESAEASSTFDGTRAFRCTEEEMNQCYHALVVRSSLPLLCDS